MESVEIDRVSGLEFGANGVVFEVGCQQPDCGGDAGVGRHDDTGDAQSPSNLGAVERPGAAKHDERKTARIEALLHGARADRIRHIGIDNGENALGRFFETEAKPNGQAANGAPCGGGVEPHGTTQKIIRVESAKH